MGDNQMRWALLALALASCSGGGGGGGSPPPYPGRIQPDANWTTYGTGSGIIQRLQNPFDFPVQPRSVNYVYTAPQGLALGKTITLDYTITGDGNLGVADGSDQPPATMRLFIWSTNSDTNNDRWWCPSLVNLAVGSGQFSCVIDQTWTGVFGQAGNPLAFNPFAMGFTFGGQFFAGHGVWATSGTTSFKINSYTVQ